MERRKLSVSAKLLDEAQSIEVLLTDLSPPLEAMEEYWQVTMSLIDLIRRLESLVAGPKVDERDDRYVRLRGELSRLESRITLLEREEEKAD